MILLGVFENRIIIQPIKTADIAKHQNDSKISHSFIHPIDIADSLCISAPSSSAGNFKNYFRKVIMGKRVNAKISPSMSDHPMTTIQIGINR